MKVKVIIISEFKSSQNKPHFKTANCRPKMQITQLKFGLSENRFYNNNRCYGFRILFKSKLLKSPLICTYTSLRLSCPSDHSLLKLQIIFLYAHIWSCGQKDLFD